MLFTIAAAPNARALARPARPHASSLRPSRSAHFSPIAFTKEMGMDRYHNCEAKAALYGASYEPVMPSPVRHQGVLGVGCSTSSRLRPPHA